MKVFSFNGSFHEFYIINGIFCSLSQVIKQTWFIKLSECVSDTIS